MINFEDINAQISSVTLFSGVFEDTVLSNFKKLLNLVDKKAPIDEIAKTYSDMVKPLYNEEYEGNWTNYIKDLIHCDNNYFSRACAKGDYYGLGPQMQTAADTELTLLYEIACMGYLDLTTYLAQKYPDKRTIINSFIHFESYITTPDVNSVQKEYEKNGVGVFAKYKAFKFSSDNKILPVKNPDDIRLANLKDYKREQETIIDNTLAFLNGRPANNILLYGDRGTGKSSTVKALLNEYYSKGLRVIQVFKENLKSLDIIMAQIVDIPLKFIIFIDDLTFAENDDNFGALKAVLEGSLEKRPSNMLIYATTNRRHLVKETFTAREGDEVHLADTIDETVSLSDRFGIIVTFTLPSREKFFEILKEMKNDRKLEISDEELCKKAEEFALSKGNRSPRIARQFLDDLEAKL